MQRQTNTSRCNLQLSTERKTSKLVPSEQLAQQQGRGWRQSSGLQKEQSVRLGEIKKGSPRVSNLDHHCLFDLILWFLNDQLLTRSSVYLHQHSTVPHITLYSLSPAPKSSTSSHFGLHLIPILPSKGQKALCHRPPCALALHSSPTQLLTTYPQVPCGSPSLTLAIVLRICNAVGIYFLSPCRRSCLILCRILAQN